MLASSLPLCRCDILARVCTISFRRDGHMFHHLSHKKINGNTTKNGVVVKEGAGFTTASCCSFSKYLYGVSV